MQIGKHPAASYDTFAHRVDAPVNDLVVIFCACIGHPPVNNHVQKPSIHPVNVPPLEKQ